MKRVVLTECIIALLILLFVYTGVSKLIDIPDYKEAMHVQPFPFWMQRLSYALPFVEMLVGLGLVFEQSRGIALWSCAFLMLVFTLYTALVVFHFFKQVPCTCGGVIQKMNWNQHLVFNLFFLLLSIIALWLYRQQKYLCINKGVS